MDRCIRCFIDDNAIYLYVTAGMSIASLLASLIHAFLILNLNDVDMRYGVFIVDTTLTVFSLICFILICFVTKKIDKRNRATQTVLDEPETQLEQRTTTAHPGNHFSSEYSSFRNEVFASTSTHPVNSYELNPVHQKPNATILKEQGDTNTSPNEQIFHRFHSSSSVRNEFLPSAATYPIDGHKLSTRHLQTNAAHFGEIEYEESPSDEQIYNMVDSIKKLVGSKKAYTLHLKGEQKSKFRRVSRRIGSPNSKYIEREFIPHTVAIPAESQDFTIRQLTSPIEVDEGSELILLSPYGQQEPVRNQFYSQPGGRENFVSHSDSMHINDQINSQTIPQSHSENTCKRQILATSAENSSSYHPPKQMCDKRHQVHSFKDDPLVSYASHMVTNEENPSSNQYHNQCHPRYSQTITKHTMLGTIREHSISSEESSSSNGNENPCNSKSSRKVLPEAKVRHLPGKTFSNFDDIHNTPGTSQEPLGKARAASERPHITSREENLSHHDFHQMVIKSLTRQNIIQDIPGRPSLTMNENFPPNRDRIQNKSIPRGNKRFLPKPNDKRLHGICQLSRVLYNVGRYSQENPSSVGHNRQSTAAQVMEINMPILMFSHFPSGNVLVNITLTLTSLEYRYLMQTSNFDVYGTEV